MLWGAPMTPARKPLIILKCWTPSFKALKDGTKRFEYRKDDRPYEVGVTVKQEEWNPNTEYTGAFLYHDITWIIRGGIFGIPEGYCIFSTTEPRDTQEAAHTSPPAPEQHIIGDAIRKHKEDWFNVGYAEGAKAAREQVLDELTGYANTLVNDYFRSSLLMEIESLRTRQEPQQEGVSEV